MKFYESIIERNLIKQFPSYYDGLETYDNFVANNVDLEGLIACAALFTPSLIEYKDRIYIANNRPLSKP